MERISVLIVDDHAVVRRGLRAFLESEDDIEVVGEAADGAEALDLIQALIPNVILMDLVMPRIDGIAAIREAKQLSPTSRVLVLTSFSEDAKVFPSIKAGAMGYLLKDVPPEELGRAIRCVAGGEFLLHPSVATKVIDEFTHGRSETASLAKLTPRETEVLTLVARGLSNRQIARELSISIKTVKTHVSNILGKLQMMDRTQAAIFAVQEGLVFEEGGEGPRTQG